MDFEQFKQIKATRHSTGSKYQTLIDNLTEYVPVKVEEPQARVLQGVARKQGKTIEIVTDPSDKSTWICYTGAYVAKPRKPRTPKVVGAAAEGTN